jgi:hypothetical protein
VTLLIVKDGMKLKVGEVIRGDRQEKKVVNEYFPWFECEQIWNFQITNLEQKSMEILLGTGIFYDLNAERFYGIFPGGLKTSRFDFIGVEYETKTFNEKIYLGTDFRCTSGLPWSDIVSGELSLLELEFQKEWREIDWSRAVGIRMKELK